MTDKDKKSSLKLNHEGHKELEKAEEQFEKFENQVNEMTYDRMKLVPKPETEPQDATKRAINEMDKYQDIYLKPISSVASKEPFNEKFRCMWEYDKQYVRVIFENIEIRGDTIEIWTKPYPGLPAQFWQVPVNKAVYAPRHLAEQVKRKFYHRLTMQEQAHDQNFTGSHAVGSFYGKIVVDNVIPRLDARKAESDRKLIYMAAGNF